jgi:hypothetical protein
MTEDKKEKKDNFKEFTDTQKEELRKITQARRISKAPPPITPVRSYFGVTLSQKSEKKDFAEIKRQLLSEAGKKGGSKSKINEPILEAVKTYMKENPTTQNKSNEHIARQFCKKYNKSRPMDVTIEEIEWEVYCKGEDIISDAEEAYSKKFNRVVKSISYTTFRNEYIKRAKQTILNDNHK